MKFQVATVAAAATGAVLGLVAEVQAAAYDKCTLPTTDWVLTDQGVGQSMAYAIAPESTGVWIAGSYRTTLKLQGPGGALSVTSTPSDPNQDDMYIAKVSFDGTPLTIKGFQGPGRQLIIDASFDSTNGAERLVVSGYYLGSITFKSGVELSNSKAQATGYFDGFMASIDVSDPSNPNPIWATAISNTRSTKYAGVAVSAGVNPVGVGTSCEEDMSKDPDPSTLKRPDLCKGFMVGYNKDTGAQLWKLDTASFFPETVQTDSSTAYIIGTLSAAQVFTIGGSSATKTPIGKSDIVVISLDSSTGNINYVAQYGAAGATYSAWEIILGTSHFYLSGGKTGGAFDGFLIKGVKSNGNKAFEVDAPYSRGLALDATQSSVYLMGLYSETLTLSSTLTLRSEGSYDMFLIKMSTTNGEGQWGITMGGTGMEYPWAMFKDPSSNVYISGLTASSTAKFGDEKFIDSSVGYNDLFVLKVRTSSEVLPGCLSDCSVVANGCFIDNECYAAGEYSPFYNHGCFKCDPTVSKTSWTGPDTKSGDWCFINNLCVAKDKRRVITANSVSSQSRCQTCDPSSSSTAWSLLPGYKVASDGSTCESDGSIPAGSVTPGCTGSQSYNEAYCGTVTPCYDSSTDSCIAAISLCPSGTTYSADCPGYPLKPCYQSSTHSCVNTTFSLSSGTVNCGTTGQYLYTDKCPTAYPCYDHENRVCTTQPKPTGSSDALGVVASQKNAFMVSMIAGFLTLLIALV